MPSKLKRQKGFTLIELAVVGIFLGILAVFAISSFNASATNSARAKGLAEASLKLTSTWSLVVQYCNISPDISSVAVSSLSLGNIARSNTAYLLGSNSSLNTTYTACISQSGIRQLFGTSTGAAGAEKVQDYSISSVSTLNIAGRNHLAVSYSEVPESVALVAYNQLSSVPGAATVASLPASDNSDKQYRFSTVTAGKRTITIINPI